jgi:hypothetical protein
VAGRGGVDKSPAEALAAEIVAAVQAGDDETVLSSVMAGLGMPRHARPAGMPTPKVRIYAWLCPWCDPAGVMNPGGSTGRMADGSRCLDCGGCGMLTADQVKDPSAFEAGELKPVPRPPAVMRRPCVDCAYRPGSPESGDDGETPIRPAADVPFFCHHGLVRVGDAYESPAYVGSLPLGAMVCAGWWALATGKPLPVEDFRDPGGAERPDAAPRVP